jgi:3',5'-cyclic AMP phosphodiesterase CpdA
MITNSEPVIIPGNHDARIVGNKLWSFGESYKYIAKLGGRPLEQDLKHKCLFFCFDSSKKGNLAKGEVIEDDLVRFGKEVHVLAARTPETKEWLRVALVHHHPFKFNAAAEGWTANILRTLHIPEGRLLDMSKSERFIAWCADRGIQLILFGHRHVQRKISQVVPVRNVARRGRNSTNLQSGHLGSEQPAMVDNVLP